jgi:hypothetical protein
MMNGRDRQTPGPPDGTSSALAGEDTERMPIAFVNGLGGGAGLRSLTARRAFGGSHHFESIEAIDDERGFVG